MLKLLVVLLFIAILGSLFSGLFYLHRDRNHDNYTGLRTVKALTLRIGLSIALFALLLLAFRFGLIPGYSQ